MIISGENLNLSWWNDKGFGYTQNLKEIDEEKICYDLLPEQILSECRYDGCGVNKIMYFDILIRHITEKGITFSESSFNIPINKREYLNSIFLPWKKEFINYKKQKEICNLVIYPCDVLFEKPNIKQLLNNNIWHEDGIWYKHGGRRWWSRFEENLKYLCRPGQKVKQLFIQCN